MIRARSASTQSLLGSTIVVLLIVGSTPANAEFSPALTRTPLILTDGQAVGRQTMLHCTTTETVYEVWDNAPPDRQPDEYWTYNLMIDFARNTVDTMDTTDNMPKVIVPATITSSSIRFFIHQLDGASEDDGRTFEIDRVSAAITVHWKDPKGLEGSCIPSFCPWAGVGMKESWAAAGFPKRIRDAAIPQ
jgi:hypothetical protein